MKMVTVKEKAIAGRASFLEMSKSTSLQRSKALKILARKLAKEKNRVFIENAKDLQFADKLVSEGRISEALIRRLKVDKNKLKEIIEEVESVNSLPDPIGKNLSAMELDKGLELFQISVPIGVICTIFESRPDALVQISSLCIKSGNSVLLKGGSEALHSNKILAELIRESLEEAGLSKDSVQLIETREEIAELLKLESIVDLIIPRGSNELVKYIQENTRIPVLGHSSGICHVYIDKYADMKKAIDIAYDAKVQYCAVCNAMENLLVDKSIAEKFLPKIAEKYRKAHVEMRCDDASIEILKKKGFDARPANAKDWDTEYNDLIISIKIAGSLNEAIEFINKHSSKHTDSIVTENRKHANEFLMRVDSASVFWNASTRFSDGYRFGKGAEVGISTGKIHARGPAGIESLMTYKYVLSGKGHIVADYAGPKAKAYTHKKLKKEFKFT